MKSWWIVAGGLVAAVALSGCVGPQVQSTDSGDEELAAMLISAAEADGWEVTPDDGPVDGKSGDCTGAPYDWPDAPTLSHASQFLDRADESVALVIKRVDGNAADGIEALRGALAPCTPSTGQVLTHGAIIEEAGDDSFAYQTPGTDDAGDFLFTNMLVSCGDLIVEVFAQTYSNELDQQELETLVRPAVTRIETAGGCDAE